MAKLNPKQKLFAHAYAASKNATQAAIAAGYSKKAAHSCGPRMLENADVLREIERSLRRQFKKAELTGDMVLSELKKLAFTDLSEAYDEKGKMLLPRDMPEDIRAALNSVETDEIKVNGKFKIGERRKIKLSDKTRALELLAKHFKLLTDVTELQTKDDKPLVLLTMPGNGSEAPKQETDKPAQDTTSEAFAGKLPYGS